MNSNFITLELHKILELLAKECSNETTRSAALALSPSTDLRVVREEICKTADALELSTKLGTPVFYRFTNITGLADRAASGSVLSLEELIEIRTMLHQISALTDWYNQIEESGAGTIDGYFECIFPNTYLERLLDSAILSGEELADDASPELASIRRKITRAGFKIKDSLESMIKSSEAKKYLQDTRVTLRDGRYVLPVKSEYKGAVEGLVHDTSSTGATLFIEPMSVVEANNEIRVLKAQEQEEIHRIMTWFSQLVGEFKEQLISGFNASAKLNLYFAKANLAAKMRAGVPEISDDGVIMLKKARHPLIDSRKVVPIDFSLGENYSSLIITGPNTGGKTVILKTVGLLTSMTMCGLLIPAADGSRISLFKNILVDIGDMQSIEESLSTFSSHMTRIVNILQAADGSSLVLLDELGSGTDPVEGAALAVAIINRLRGQGAKTVCTTHYQELKLYAVDTADTENASCEFDVDTLKPTYRLIIGTPGKSNAFEISEQLGIPSDIIEEARTLIGEDNRRLEKVLEALDKSRLELDLLRDHAAEDRAEAAKALAELEKEKQALYEQKEKELELARREANAIVKRVTAQAESIVDELDAVRREKEKNDFSRRALNAKQSAKQALNRLYDIANPVTHSGEDYVLPRPLVKGDTVLIADMNKNAIVVSPPDSSGNCIVHAGVMKTKINVSKLRLVEGKKPEQQKKSTGRVTSKGVESKMTRRPVMELDIRGYAADDGIYELDSFLDGAVMSGAGSVTIIHGKGTGILKNAVREHLRRHKLVKSFRKGLFGEGEDGVTIVELK